jgi:DNA-binding transcriptional MerR regulator
MSETTKMSESAGSAGSAGDLVPIDEVAKRLGLRASAIRYYEERGLVVPVSRQAGRRWYGPAEIRQLAIIRYWQTSGLMSLEQISDILAGPEAARGWTEVVEDHMETLGIQLERMAAARAFLEHSWPSTATPRRTAARTTNRSSGSGRRRLRTFTRSRRGG